MSDPEIEPREHYVYALYREDGITPFYIGMGKGSRWLQHERLSKYRRNHKDHIIAAMLDKGLVVLKTKLKEHLTKPDAIALEIELIAGIGRTPAGPLVNVTGGGEGILGLSPEALALRAEKVAAAQRRPEVNAKRSATQKGRKGPPCSEEKKAKLRAANLGKKMPDHVRKIALECLAKGRGGPMSDHTKERLRASHLGVRMPDEQRAKIAAANRGRIVSDEIKAKLRGRIRTPQHRAKLAVALKAKWTDPEFRARQSIAISEGMKKAAASKNRSRE